jgi:hypothetical protein
MCAVVVVVFEVCNSVGLLKLFVVTFCKCLINLITKTNFVYRQSRDNTLKIGPRSDLYRPLGARFILFEILISFVYHSTVKTN